MYNFVENLKTKPEHVKKRFAFIVSFSITFVIFAGWIASYGLKSSSVLTDETTGESRVENPVSSMTASVVGAYKDIKSIIFGKKDIQEKTGSIEVTGGGI